MIKMIVFDVAGTTIDEDNIVYKTLRKAINAHGYDYSLEKVLDVGAGQEKLSAIKSILALDGNHDEALAQKIFSEFKEQLQANYLAMTPKEVSGASDAFKKLRAMGILVVLNTGYDRKTANYLVDKIGWQIGKDIDGLVTASDAEKHRPHPDMIEFAMKKFNISDPKEVAKIGDSAIDIEEGKNAGCILNFGITTGAQTREQIERANPYKIVNSLAEMVDDILSKK